MLNLLTKEEKKGYKKESVNFEDSSTILSATYDPILGSLIINFVNGGEYEYAGVPYELFTEMQSAPSAGKFFHSKIKHKFEFLKK